MIFCLLKVARRGSCGHTRQLNLFNTQSFVLCSKMWRNFLRHLDLKAWILFSEEASLILEEYEDDKRLVQLALACEADSVALKILFNSMKTCCIICCSNGPSYGDVRHHVMRQSSEFFLSVFLSGRVEGSKCSCTWIIFLQDFLLLNHVWVGYCLLEVDISD